MRFSIWFVGTGTVWAMTTVLLVLLGDFPQVFCCFFTCKCWSLLCWRLRGPPHVSRVLSPCSPPLFGTLFCALRPLWFPCSSSQGHLQALPGLPSCAVAWKHKTVSWGNCKFHLVWLPSVGDYCLSFQKQRWNKVFVRQKKKLRELTSNRSSKKLFLIFFYWSIIALQCCFSFRCTMKWISCMYTYIPSLLGIPPPHPHPTHLGHHRAPSWASCAL